MARLEATRAVGFNSEMSEAHYIRAPEKCRLDAPDADVDCTAAKALYLKIADRFARLGLTPKDGEISHRPLGFTPSPLPSIYG